MTKTKIKWEEPELIIMVRHRPEEAVLLGCKSSSVPNAYQDGFGNANRWCIQKNKGSGCQGTYCEGATAS